MMTKEQMTAYDESLKECWEIAKQGFECPDLDLVQFAFGGGYRFGVWQQMEEQKSESGKTSQIATFAMKRPQNFRLTAKNAIFWAFSTTKRPKKVRLTIFVTSRK